MKKMTKGQFSDMYEVVGAAMEVYNTLGRGLSETIYQEALQMELTLRGIPFQSEVLLAAYYKELRLKRHY